MFSTKLGPGVRPKVRDALVELRRVYDQYGDVWYADASKSASGDGKSWQNAFATITEGVAAASTNDVLYVTGEFDEEAAITVDVQGLRIIGDNPSQNGYPTMIYPSDNYHLMVIKAHNVHIANIGFVPNKNTYDGIHIGDTNGQAYWKLTIENCKFDGFATGEYAIRSGATAGDSGAPDAPDITIRNCLFRSFATACLQGNWTRALIENNIFHVDASTIGYEHVPNGGSRPDTVVRGNEFLGAASSDVGVKVTNTPSAGTYLVTRNILANLGTPVTSKATNDAVFILNYSGDASGGALTDPST